jgi:HPt (histidine-containing phosphotransfer) domain-containing protein
MPNTEDLKLYSLLIRYHDEQPEIGDYSSTVWAKDEEEAEAFVRQQMADDNGEDPEEADYGSVIDIAEGAFWRAAELEAALREIASLAKTGDVEALAKIASLAETELRQLDALPVADFNTVSLPQP